MNELVTCDMWRHGAVEKLQHVQTENCIRPHAIAESRELKEQARIADELLADARRMLDEFAQKHGITLIGEPR